MYMSNFVNIYIYIYIYTHTHTHIYILYRERETERRLCSRDLALLSGARLMMASFTCSGFLWMQNVLTSMNLTSELSAAWSFSGFLWMKSLCDLIYALIDPCAHSSDGNADIDTQWTQSHDNYHSLTCVSIQCSARTPNFWSISY